MSFSIFYTHKMKNFIGRTAFITKVKFSINDNLSKDLNFHLNEEMQ